MSYACKHNWLNGYCDLCGSVKPIEKTPDPFVQKLAEFENAMRRLEDTQERLRRVICVLLTIAPEMCRSQGITMNMSY